MASQSKCACGPTTGGSTSAGKTKRTVGRTGVCVSQLLCRSPIERRDEASARPPIESTRQGPLTYLTPPNRTVNPTKSYTGNRPPNRTLRKPHLTPPDPKRRIVHSGYTQDTLRKPHLIRSCDLTCDRSPRPARPNAPPTGHPASRCQVSNYYMWRRGLPTMLHVLHVLQLDEASQQTAQSPPLFSHPLFTRRPPPRPAVWHRPA
jgi:hypothetical protein